MATDVAVNGTAIARLTTANWTDDPASAGLDGSTPRLRWVRVTVGAEVLTAAEFNTLYALEGQRVSVDLPPYGDRNNANYKRYFGALCQRVSGEHSGPAFVGVSCDFLVRV
jgi:hypothetical protein